MHLNIRNALQGFFLCIFSSLTCLKNKHVFSKWDLLQWKATARLYWDLLTSGRALSLFLKCEKIPALLYVGKGREYRPFCDFRPVPSSVSFVKLFSWFSCRSCYSTNAYAYAYFENPKPKSARGGCKAGACGCWSVCERHGARAEPKFSSSAREASQDGSCWYSKSEAGSVTV